MSLVILSNQEEIGVGNDSEWEKPYSFNNALKETLKIPANSEVALQSIKVNRNGGVLLDGRTRFYECYGVDLENPTNVGVNIEDTTQEPILTQIRTNDDNFSEVVSLTEFVSRTGLAMDRGLPHPDLYGLQTASIRYDSGNIFEGINLNYTAGVNMGNDSNAQQSRCTQFYSNSYSAIDGLVTSVVGDKLRFKTPPVPATDSNDRVYAQMETMQSNPLSHYNGEARFDIAGVCKDTVGYEVTENCAMGLVADNLGGGGDWDLFSDTGGDLNTSYGAGEGQQFSYVVRMEQIGVSGDFFLFIGQSTYDANADGVDQSVEYCMREIKYYGWDTSGAGGTAKSEFTTRYNMTSNTKKIKQIKFQADGEIMNIWYNQGTIDSVITGSGDTNNYPGSVDWKILCSFSQASVSDWLLLNDITTDPTIKLSYKQHCPQPIGQDKWVMYPAVFIGSGVKDKYIDLTKNGGRTTGIIKNNDRDSNWYVRMTATHSGDEDLRIYTARSMFLMGGGEVNPTMVVYEQLGHTGGLHNKPKDYSYNTMLEESNIFKYSGLANARLLLGFSVGVLTTSTGSPSNVGDVVTYKGDISPKFAVSNLFVRLNNFTQTSYNAGIGRPSKVIYTMPRFDNSGREDGIGLFFEPAERVYLDLGNSEELFINDFSIDIVDNRERLSRTLIGTTVICLHIRPIRR